MFKKAITHKHPNGAHTWVKAGGAVDGLPEFLACVVETLL